MTTLMIYDIRLLDENMVVQTDVRYRASNFIDAMQHAKELANVCICNGHIITDAEVHFTGVYVDTMPCAITTI